MCLASLGFHVRAMALSGRPSWRAGGARARMVRGAAVAAIGIAPAMRAQLRTKGSAAKVPRPFAPVFLVFSGLSTETTRARTCPDCRILLALRDGPDGAVGGVFAGKRE